MTRRIVLEDVYKGYTADQDKWIPPEETVSRFRERLRRIDLDILRDTVRIDSGRLGIPVYFSLCGGDAEAIIGTKKQMGKGGTPSQAEASAVMELAERFSFFSYDGDADNFVVEEHRNLGDRALPFEAIARSVHEESEDLERAQKAFERLPMRWCPAYNLTRQEEVLVPFDWFFAINEFNGPSAGNCAEEALLQGICEVVERHVSSLVSRGRMRTAALRLDGVQDGLVREMLGKYRNAGVRLYPTDFTLGMGIPTVGVLAWDPTTFPEKSEIVWTAGTTPSPEKALSRALTEVAQLAGDFDSGSCYVASGLPKLKGPAEADFVMNPGTEVSLESLPDLSDPNLRVEVENCLSALSGGGFEVLAVETTHPLLQIPAFYTIIPGAHFRERAAGTSVGMFTAKLIAEQGPPGWALEELERMDALLPGKYYIRFFQGLCLHAAGDFEGALERLEAALDLAPKAEDLPSIYSYMGQCLKGLERYREALHVLARGEREDSERTDIHNLMGFCHFKLKEHEEAIERFRKVLALDPSSAIDYANIASNYREMGDRANAVRYYRLALELDPGIEFARDNLARLEGTT
jgi:ribosomal protein S12 methylthiotransferase accessory factor